MKGNLGCSGVFAIVGLGLLGGGIYSVWHTQRFLQTAISVEGLVTENIKRYKQSGKYDRDLTPSYRPRISFRTKEGRSVVFTSSNASSGSPKYRRNQTVPIVYDPRDPHHAFIRAFRELWLGSTFLLSLGIVLFGPGIGVLIWKLAKRPQEPPAAPKRASHSY